MNIFERATHQVTLIFGALLLCSSLTAYANDLQDATSLFKKGQQDQALSKVNNYLSGNPKDAQGRFLKGLIYTQQGKTNDAIQIFTSLTQDYPELPEPYNNLAVLYASLSQYDKAKSALEKAIQTHPSYATAHENLGDIYAKLASQAYDRALQLDSSNSATQTKLALIQDLFTEDGKSNHAKNTRQAAAVQKPVAAPVINTPPQIVAQPAAQPVAKPVVSPPAKVVEPNKPVAKAETPVKNAPPSDKAIRDTINAWTSAWESQNVKKYLSFYASNFRPPNGESRSAWAKSRKERISKPKSIEITLSNMNVDFTDNNHATVKFRQLYRANQFKVTGNKTMVMVKTGDNWLIQEENAK